MARRLDRIDARALRNAVRAIDALYAELRVVGLDEELAQLAGELAEDHGLRGYDAVHLASAISLGHDELVAVTWDRDLAAAVSDCGYAVVPA
jgi:predicted nucleic acid-binding protein